MAVTPIREKWAGTLTDRERFRRQMHYQSVDRSFNMEFGYWEENFTEWKLFRDHGITNNWEADQFFSFDRLAGIGGRFEMVPAMEEEVVEVNATSKILRNRDGLFAEVPLDAHSTIPHYIKSSINNPDDWQQIKEERFDPDHPDRVVDIEALKRQHPADRDYPLGVHCGSMIGRVRDMLTFEGLCYALYDYPDMVDDMIETRCVLVERFLDQVLPHFDFDYASGWEDICFKNGPIVPVPFFRELVMPRYKRISAKLRAHGIDLWYTDCDGDVRPLLPLFLEGGINCMFPFEVMGCAHPGEILDEWGPEMRIMGGVDKIQLAAGRPAIKKYLDSLAPYVERGGFIPFCDHRCPPNVPEDDYLYYLDLKEDMFGLKA